jgi:hypothetical protein
MAGNSMQIRTKTIDEAASKIRGEVLDFKTVTVNSCYLDNEGKADPSLLW